VKRLTIPLMLALVWGCTPNEQTKTKNADVKVAGVHLLEEVKGEAGKTVIPYKKYELDNGLTLILVSIALKV